MKINDLIFNCELTDIIDELKSQLKLNGIHLLQITKDGSKDVMVQCPYHSNGQERRPSAGISKEDGTFHCFACGEVHSLTEVISYCFGKGDDLGKYGWIWLLKNFITISVEERPDLELNLSRDHSKKEEHTYVTEEELDSYRYTHPYMYKRRLTDEIIEMFDIGYDKNTDCITFPNRDLNGNCLFIARRSVRTKFFSYPKDVEKPVYGLYELSKCNIIKGGHNPERYSIIICESMLDALTCWVYGKPAVALNGLGTPKQFKVLRDFPCRKYIIATDMDKRGLQARKKIREALFNKIVTEYSWDLNTAKDINDMDQEMFENLDEYF